MGSSSVWLLKHIKKVYSRIVGSNISLHTNMFAVLVLSLYENTTWYLTLNKRSFKNQLRIATLTSVTFWKYF